MIPAHWMQQVITPTWGMNVARAQVGGCWLFSDLVQEDCVGGEEGFQEDSVLNGPEERTRPGTYLLDHKAYLPSLPPLSAFSCSYKDLL